MSYMSGIAGMLARGGQQTGAQIGNALAGIGANVGGLLSQRARYKEGEERAGEVRALIEENADNPAKLNSLGREYETRGDEKSAQVFYDAAKQAVSTQAGSAVSTAIGATDPAVIMEQAQAIAKIPGMQAQAMQLLQMAQQMKERQANDATLTARKQETAAQAEALGLNELAKQIRSATSLERVNQISDKLVEKQMERLPELSVPARRKILLDKGYSPAFVGQLDLKTMSKQEFKSYVDLMKGSVEMFLENGKPVTYRVTDSGMVVKDGKLVDPSTLNLTEAPNQQVIKNVSEGMATQLTKLGAEQFTELYGQATKSAESLRSIENVMGDIDTMFTGSLANIKLQTMKFMKDVGIPVDDLAIENTEVFQAESAKRVADYITNLGAGTGLSDKDLEFTRKVVAGDVTLDANTIKRMLSEFRDASIRKIEGYNKTRESISSKLSEDEQSALAFYTPIIVPTTKRFEGFEIVTQPES